MRIVYLIIARTFGALRGYSMKRAGMEAPGADNTLCLNFLRSLICLAVSLVLWALRGFGLTNGLGVLFIILSGISNALSLYYWVVLTQYISISLIEVISMIGNVIIPMLLSPVLYNGDEASVIQWCGVLTLVIAVYFFVSDEKLVAGKGGNLAVKVIPMLMQVIGAAGAVITQKLFATYIHSEGEGSIELFNLGTFASICVCFCIIFAFRVGMAHIRARAVSTKPVMPWSAFPLRRIWWMIVLASVALYGNQYFLTAASTLPSAILYPVSYALSMLGTLVLDTFIFGKRMNWKRAVAFLFVAASIVLVNIGV